MRMILAILLVFAGSVYASRQLVETSGQMAGATSAPVSSYPCTISAWYKPLNNTSNHSIVYIGSTTDQRRFLIYRTGSSSNNVAVLDNRSDGGSTIQILAGTTPVTNTGAWYHIVGVYASSTSRKLYVNGVQENSDTSAMTTTSLNRIGVGARGAPAPFYGLYAYARIAHVAVWNVALSDAEIGELAKGANPRWIQRDAQKMYEPMWTGLSPEPDLSGNSSAGLGLTNSPASSVDNPPVFE